MKHDRELPKEAIDHAYNGSPFKAAQVLWRKLKLDPRHAKRLYEQMVVVIAAKEKVKLNNCGVCGKAFMAYTCEIRGQSKCGYREYHICRDCHNDRHHTHAIKSFDKTGLNYLRYGQRVKRGKYDT